MPSKSTILAAIDAWIRQRPGLEFGNYGDWTAYRRFPGEIYAVEV